MTRAASRVPLTERLDLFKEAHPETRIAAHYTTLSGRWEVSGPYGNSTWDNGFRMMDALEARYLEDGTA